MHSSRTGMKAILTWHSIDASGSVISIDPATFRRQVSWIAGSGLRVVDVRTLVRIAEGHAVALTFDDGFENFATHAWPVLRDHGLGATVFVATDHAGAWNAWDGGGHAGIPRLPLLRWDALGRLVEEGVVLGAHSASHRDLRRVSAVDLERETREPAERIAAETGQRPDVFAYPYGAKDERVIAAVRSYYAAACTTELRPVEGDADPHRLPRIDTWYLRRPGRLEGWADGSLGRHLRYRDRLRRVRRLVTGTPG